MYTTTMTTTEPFSHPQQKQHKQLQQQQQQQQQQQRASQPPRTKIRHCNSPQPQPQFEPPAPVYASITDIIVVDHTGDYRQAWGQ